MRPDPELVEVNLLDEQGDVVARASYFGNLVCGKLSVKGLRVVEEVVVTHVLVRCRGRIQILAVLGPGPSGGG